MLQEFMQINVSECHDSLINEMIQLQKFYVTLIFTKNS